MTASEHETFSLEAFGIPAFKWSSDEENGWRAFHNREDMLIEAPNGMKKLFHATTLYQCRDILSDGFCVGMYHMGSKSSPAGIWGCENPGHCLDRCPLRRGFSYQAVNEGDRLIMCGWDCPVVLAWNIDKRRIRTHGDPLKDENRTRVLVHPLPSGSIWNVRDRPTSIWIHKDLYERFKNLPKEWGRLLDGTAVACRSKIQYPWDLYEAGKASPMICGRVCDVANLQEANWSRAINSDQWYCPTCGYLRYQKNKPCTG